MKRRGKNGQVDSLSETDKAPDAVVRWTDDRPQDAADWPPAGRLHPAPDWPHAGSSRPRLGFGGRPTRGGCWSSGHRWWAPGATGNCRSVDQSGRQPARLSLRRCRLHKERKTGLWGRRDILRLGQEGEVGWGGVRVRRDWWGRCCCNCSH